MKFNEFVEKDWKLFMNLLDGDIGFMDLAIKRKELIDEFKSSNVQEASK